jgi:anaerobic magnesium-protoporphyrin IX monomethyl ester cyclase
MKILLISPRGSDVYAQLGLELPPLGIGYLAAFARQQDHDVELLDMGVETITLSEEYFRRFDVVGISMDTTRYFNAMNIAKMAKDAGACVIMGGYHATFTDKETLETGLVDFIIRGEGEEIFTQLLSVLEEGKIPDKLSQVDGISYLLNGEYKKNKDARLPANLDDFPFPARDLFKLDRYKISLNDLPMTNMITSRGCPFDCFFCCSTRFGGKKWRYRSAKSIVDEIEMLYKDYGYKAFAFMDDNFTTSKKRIMDFADELEARNLTDIIWWCFSRVDVLVENEDMVKRMAEAGAFKVFLGLESANAETLEDYGKNISHRQQVQAVALLHKYGINVQGSFVMGDVKETEEMIGKTVEMAMEMDPQSLQFSIVTPFPGTRLYEKIVKEKRLLHKQWDLYDGLHSVIRTDHISPQRLEEVLFDSYKRFYLRPGRIFGKSRVSGNGYEHTNPSKKKKRTLRRLMQPVKFYKVMRSLIRTNATEKAIAAALAAAEN